MPAMPRASNKAKEIAYDILGVPACLEEDHKKKKHKKPHDGSPKISISNDGLKKP
jgi:hypothetical protein